MAKTIAVRFRRFSAALEEEARAARLSESSGSEYSAAATEEESSPDLSELVDLFLERECGAHDHDDDDDGRGDDDGEIDEDEREFCDTESCSVEMESKRKVLSLIGGEEGEDGRVRRRICAEVELAWRNVGGGLPPEGLKRRVMGSLRQRGFEAGLCKSRWAKTANYPAGEHEYIDILTTGTRYIIELSPAALFTVARPTSSYMPLLQSLPQVIVCKEESFKMMVRLMCATMRRSLKKSEMHVPPWRRHAYVQAKWFSPYKLTTNLVPAMVRFNGMAGKSFVGFETMQAGGQVCCRGEVIKRKDGFVLQIGNLNASLNEMHL